jgi:hypothetical protein
VHTDRCGAATVGLSDAGSVRILDVFFALRCSLNQREQGLYYGGHFVVGGVIEKSVVAGRARELGSDPRYLEKLSAEIRKDLGAKRLDLEVSGSSKPPPAHQFATWIACGLHGSCI